MEFIDSANVVNPLATVVFVGVVVMLLGIATALIGTCLDKGVLGASGHRCPIRGFCDDIGGWQQRR